MEKTHTVSEERGKLTNTESSAYLHLSVIAVLTEHVVSLTY